MTKTTKHVGWDGVKSLNILFSFFGNAFLLIGSPFFDLFGFC